MENTGYVDLEKDGSGGLFPAGRKACFISSVSILSSFKDGYCRSIGNRLGRTLGIEMTLGGPTLQPQKLLRLPGMKVLIAVEPQNISMGKRRRILPMDQSSRTYAGRAQ